LFDDNEGNDPREDINRDKWKIVIIDIDTTNNLPIAEKFSIY